MQVSQLHAGVCGRPLPVRARVQTARRTPFCVEARKQLTVKESRIGKAPITVPTGVQFDVQGQTVTVKVSSTYAQHMPALYAGSGSPSCSSSHPTKDQHTAVCSCRRAMGTKCQRRCQTSCQ